MLEKKGLYGGMDSDTEDRLMKDGDYRPDNTLNLRNSIPDSASAGAVTNIKGNTLVDFTLPGGTNKVIGTYDDFLNSRVIYFLYNSNGYHKIISYSTVTGLATQLVGNSLLNFDPDYPVIHIDVIGDLLLWTDNNNEPSAILISKAQTGFYDSVTLRKYFDAIAYPMQIAPIAEYVSDYSYLYNNLRSKVFQFRVTWVDEMNRESSSSPISKLPVPYSELSYLPYGNYQNYINNKIELDVETGFDMVRKINIYVREGNTGDWYLAKSLVKADMSIGDNQTYTYSFYNDEVWIPVDQTYINRLFDFIPLKSQCQIQTSDKRIVYSNILEGFDNIVPDCTVEAIYGTVTPIDSLIFAANWSSSLGFYNIAGGSTSETITTTGIVGGTPAVAIIFNIGNVDETQSFSFEYATSLNSTHATLPTKTNAVYENFSGAFPAGTSSFDIATYFANLINNSPLLSTTDDGFTFSTLATVQLNSGTMYAVIISTTYTAFGGTGWTSGTQVAEVTSFVIGNGLTPSLKTGSQYDVGLVYYDNPNRSGTVQYTPTMKLKVDPYSSHQTQLGAVVGRITINHTPPSWANYYQVVITENLTKSDYIQVKVGTVAAAPSGSATRIYLDTIAAYLVLYPTATNFTYDYTPGDRVVLLYDASGNVITDFIDAEILASGTFSGNLYIDIPDSVAAPATGSFIEIYTPKKSISEKLFYEIGEVYPIVNGLHTGDIQNQTSSAPAIVEFTGDCYFKYRPGNMQFFVEDKSLSDFYSSESWSKGRPNVIDTEARQIRRETTSYYSEPYIPETNINGLSTIFDDSFEAGDIKYGSIQRTLAEDDKIEFYYQLKTSFRLCSKSMLYSADGSSSVQTAENVLSPESFYEGEYGIGDNPESLAWYGNSKYHIDPNRGVVVRLAGNGYTPISDYQMSKYFRKLLQDRKNFGEQFRAWGIYDVKHGEYILCFEEVVKVIIGTTSDVIVDGSSVSTGTSIDLGSTSGVSTGTSDREVPSDVDAAQAQEKALVQAGSSATSVDVTYTMEPVTISFSEPKNRWITLYSYYPECIGAANVGLVSYKNGALWVHDVNSIYNNFYGTQYTSKVQLISNIEPSAIKFYKNLFTESTHKWRMDATNQFGQATSLEYDDFVEQEGVFYASILRDSNTPVNLPLLFGDDMRCHSMDITLENNQTGETKLFAVNIRSERSMMTNV